MMFNNRPGIVVLPVSLSIIREYNIPESKLSPNSIQKIGEQIESEDPLHGKFIGEIPGSIIEKEMLAIYYLGRTIEDFLESEEQRRTELTNEVYEFLHPIKPDEPLRDESMIEDYHTREKYWTLTLFFEPYQWCKRVNCPYCRFPTNKTFWGQVQEEYREAAISRLERMKKPATLMMANTMLLTMPSDNIDDDYNTLDDDISHFKGINPKLDND